MRYLLIVLALSALFTSCKEPEKTVEEEGIYLSEEEKEDDRSRMMPPMDDQVTSDDPIVIAEGGVRAMQELCDALRARGVEAALTRPPGGCVTG